MKKHLQYIDGNSNKFWQITVSGLQHTVVYGKNGTSGASQTKAFLSVEECLKSAEKLVAEKIKKGYSEDGHVSVSSAVSDTRSVVKIDKQAELKALLAAYDQIIKSRKIDDLLPFLQTKSKGYVRELKKHIRNCKRYWMTFIDFSLEPQFLLNNKHPWGKRGDQTQEKIIVLSAIALFDKTEIATWTEVVMQLEEVPNQEVMDVLYWAKPNWIDTYLLDFHRKNSWIHFDYQKLRLLEERELANYNPELFARVIIQFQDYNHITQVRRHMREYIDFLVKDPIAYQRDIPLLFNYETNLHSINYLEDPKDYANAKSLWEIIFTRLLAENKLERQFFIENCLQIQTKDWNNNLKSFFRKRLEDLSPTQDDLIGVQETIFTFLHAPHAPIATYGADLVKVIYDHPNFDAESFLEWVAPMMMRTDCKAAIKKLLPVLEKLNKSKPELNKNISLLLVEVFIIADLGLQETVLKYFRKIANANEPEIAEKIALYKPMLMGNIKIELQQLMADEPPIATKVVQEIYCLRPEKTAVLTEPVTLPSTWNNILYQVGEFVHSDEVLVGEVLLNMFITQRHLFPADYAAQMEPYRQQLEHSYFESNFKNFVKDFLLTKMVNLGRDVAFSNTAYFVQLNTLFLHKTLLLKVANKMWAGSTLPLLSFPTHTPCWVEPKILLERLIEYQNTQEPIDTTDLCIAICRMPRENVNKAIPLLTYLEPTMKRLMAYCLGVSDKIELGNTSILTKLISLVGSKNNKTDHIAIWAVAARTYYPRGGFLEFEKTHLSDVPNVIAPFEALIKFKTRYNHSYKYTNPPEIEKTVATYSVQLEFPMHMNIPDHLLYSLDLFHKKQSWNYLLRHESNVSYWHSVMPQNPDPLAYLLAKSACEESNHTGSELTAFLRIVNRPEFRFSDISMFVFACCFYIENKETRMLATEVLINCIKSQRIDIKQFGAKTALLIFEKYGPLLRLIECLVGVKDVSPLHNSALFLILDTIFQHLYVQSEYANVKEKLPTNFKKLLENFLDLKVKTQQQPSAAALHYLEQWKDNAALKGLIKQII